MWVQTWHPTHPLYGALRGGYLHALITDETAARGILELFEQNFLKVS